MESVQLAIAIVFSAGAVSSTSKEGTLYFTSVWDFGGKGLYQISLPLKSLNNITLFHHFA
jgi:hypothetical protein